MILAPQDLNPHQANALQALSNLAQVADAAEGRAQRSNDEVIQRLASALEQSENNNRLLLDQNNRLNGRITQLEQRQAELESARQAEHRASEERFRALTASIQELSRQLSTKTKETEKNLEILNKRFEGHIPGPCYAGHVIPTGGPIDIQDIIKSCGF